MDKNYNNYGLAAIKAAKEGENAIEVWEKAVKELFKSKDSQDKPCPRNAFLGLCEAGCVKGIEVGLYFKRAKPNFNKQYAINAVKTLKEYPNLSRKELWIKVKVNLDLGNKTHNSQMDVVLALWDEGLIEK